MKKIIALSLLIGLFSFASHAAVSYQSTSLVNIYYFQPANNHPCWGESTTLSWSVSFAEGGEGQTNRVIKNMYIQSAAGLVDSLLGTTSISTGPLWEDPHATLYVVDANDDTCYLSASLAISDAGNCYGIHLNDEVGCGQTSTINWYQNVEADNMAFVMGNDTMTNLVGTTGELVSPPLYSNMTVQLLCYKAGHSTSFAVDIYSDCASATTATGINDQSSKTTISMFPNPATDKVQVNSAIPMQKVELFNAMGQKVSEQLVQTTNATVETSSLLPGTYFVKITTEQGQKVMKLAKI